MEIKLCGFTRKGAVEVALLEGATLIGFVFLVGHRNYVKPSLVAQMTKDIDTLRNKSVGVFVDESIESVVRIVEECQLAYVQLHGSESPSYCKSLKQKISSKIIKFFGCSEVEVGASELLFSRLNKYQTLVDIFLLDRVRQGTGKMVSPTLVAECAQQFPVMVAGGITIHNHHLYTQFPNLVGIDVSGGIENIDGQKDPILISNFMKSIKKSIKEI